MMLLGHGNCLQDEAEVVGRGEVLLESSKVAQSLAPGA